MTPPTILIAENNKQVVSVVETGLRKIGYSVLGFARTGEEVIKKAAAMCPDLVLMNISLEDDFDGIEVARQIRMELNIPVVYLVTSENPIPLEITDIIKHFSYITHPFEEKDLFFAVEMSLYKSKSEREFEKRLTLILKSVSDAVVSINEKGYVTFMNPVAETLTGWKYDEALHKDLTEIVNVSNNETSIFTKTSYMNKPVIPRPNEAILFSKNGVARPIEYYSTPIRSDKQKINGFITVFRDITI